jgi:hypothetical protein
MAKPRCRIGTGRRMRRSGGRLGSHGPDGDVLWDTCLCSTLLPCGQRRDDECSAKVLGLARRQHAPAYLAVAATGACAAPCSYLLALYALALRGCSVSRSRDSVSHSHPWLATRPPWSFVLSGRSDDRAQRSVAEKLSPAPPFHQCVVIERNLSLTQIFVILIFFISTLIICSIEKLKL